MAYDLDAIRKKIEKLTGNTSSIQLWKADLGTYKIRVLPGKNLKDGDPILQLQFYYLGENSRPILAPFQFGKRDPIDEFRRELYKSGSQEDRAMGKMLQPRMRAYVPIIVRGQEDKGVQVWSFNKNVLLRLLGFYIDEDSDIANFTDPVDGLDLKVEIKRSGKVYGGRAMNDFIIDPTRKSTPLCDDVNLAKKWMDASPDVLEMYELKSFEELKEMLDRFLDGDTSPVVDASENTPTVKSSDALDKLVNDVTPVKEDKKAAGKTPAKRAVKVQENLDALDAELDELCKS